MLRIDQRIILVTRPTRQQQLIAKYGTPGQAAFYVSRSRSLHAGARVGGVRALAKAQGPSQRKMMAEIARAEDLGAADAMSDLRVVEEQSRTYEQIVAGLRQELDFDIPVQVVDRMYVPKMVFGPKDVIVAVGQDGLVANVAKYAVGLPIIGVNPDPAQYDGVLLPFQRNQARSAVQRALEGRAKIRLVTLAEARLNDGQRLLAFNDLFVGARSHVSARYRLETSTGAERQSSSGIIVSTGAGSTGWLSSILNMARGIAALPGQAPGRPQTAAGPQRLFGSNLPPLRRRVSASDLFAQTFETPLAASFQMQWEDRKLAYVVREPFASKSSSASIIAGMLGDNESLIIESLMGPEGTIFSDGVEADFLPFPEGMIATITVARETARLVVA